MKNQSVFTRGAVVAALLLGSAQASVVQITSIVTQIDDTNWWQYDYQISDVVFQANEGFTIFFDDPGFGNFKDLTYDESYWTGYSSPDPEYLMGGGFIDLLALSEIDLLSSPEYGLFSVQVEWLGGGAPTLQQAFETYYDDGLTYTPGGSGLTTPAAPPVPLPSTFLLFGSGLTGLLGWRMNKKGLISLLLAGLRGWGLERARRQPRHLRPIIAMTH